MHLTAMGACLFDDGVCIDQVSVSLGGFENCIAKIGFRPG